jgi:hypothetical protein
MPPATHPQSMNRDKHRDLHREQVDRVRESLRAGVVYTRPGRVGKPPGKQR